MSLIESAKKNNVIELKRLIQNGVDINGVDGFGCTALFFAVEDGRVECVTALIDAKADVDKAHKYGDTPLHTASYYGRAAVVWVRRFCSPIGGGSGCLNATDVMLTLQLLIKHKANVNAFDSNGSSPLHCASVLGRVACVQVRLCPLCRRLVQLVIDMSPADARRRWCSRG